MRTSLSRCGLNSTACSRHHRHRWPSVSAASKLLGTVIEDRLAVGVDRRRRRPVAIVAPAVLVVGQDAQVGQVLQPPRFALPPRLSFSSILARPEEVAHVGVVVVFQGQRHGLDHQLQGADAVAFDGIDDRSAAALVAAIELAGHDEALVRDVHVFWAAFQSSRQFSVWTLTDFVQQGVESRRPG